MRNIIDSNGPYDLVQIVPRGSKNPDSMTLDELHAEYARLEKLGDRAEAKLERISDCIKMREWAIADTTQLRARS